MIEAPTLPGLYYEQVPRRAEPSPLRSDVAGFVGRTKRGPVGVAVRVEGLRDFCAQFGGPQRESDFFHAVRGYFENGGQVAHIVRVHPGKNRQAVAEWNVDGQDGIPNLAGKHRITATSAGPWADGLQVLISYMGNGPEGNAILSIRVESDCETTEYIRLSVPSQQEPGKEHEDLLAGQSRLIRIERCEDSGSKSRQQTATSSSRLGPWELTLKLPCCTDEESAEAASVSQHYVEAISRLGDEPEVALLAAPSLHRDIPNEDRQQRVLQAMVDQAVETQDRLVLIDPPAADAADPGSTITFVNNLRGKTNAGQGRRRVAGSPERRRVAAMYSPWLRVPDGTGDVTEPYRSIAPSGHVAGVMSRIDRERGAHHTPANVPVFDVVDASARFARDVAGLLNEANINVIRCVPGRGLMIQGGRTLDVSRDGRFVAHRRFIHRLIRAIRRVAEPNVFETNGPELWLTLIRAVTTVLLEAFRGGALQGERPEEAFRVRCDEETNPLTEREQGKVLCEIDLALAAPMEFITIRVSVGTDGQVEVFDT